MSEALAVITARGGSKGVRSKNIRHLNGKPALVYAIDVAKSCAAIKTTVVSTDSEEIRQIALNAGAECPFLRPAELATDIAKQEDALIHAMEFYKNLGASFQYICLLEPTVPLRRVSSLEEGFKILSERTDVDAVFSVMRCEVSPLSCNVLRPDRLMRDWMDERFKWANRQELPVYYHPTPVVTISRWQTFLEQRTFLHDRTYALEVDSLEGRDIDTPTDFVLLQTLLNLGISDEPALKVLVNG